MKYCYSYKGKTVHTNKRMTRNPFTGGRLTTAQAWRIGRTKKAQRWAGFSV